MGIPNKDGRKAVFSRPRNWPTASADPLWGTGYRYEKLYCDCIKCMAMANATSRQGRQKGKG